MNGILGREPVLWLAVINTAIALAAILYPDRLDAVTQAGIIALANAVIALLARNQVTPTNAPNVPSGTSVTVTDAKGDAAKTVQV